MEKVVRERMKKREKALRVAKEFAECTKKVFDEVSAFLFGSYLRGDFNEWSDIDVLIVAKDPPKNPLRRLDLVESCLLKYPEVEPVIVSVEEFNRMVKKRNPIISDIKKRKVVLIDDLNLSLSIL